MEAVSLMPQNRIEKNNTIYGVIKESKKNLSAEDLVLIGKKLNIVAEIGGVDLTKTKFYRDLFEVPSTTVSNPEFSNNKDLTKSI